MKRPKPDKRPRWSDLNLLVIRDYKMQDGTRKTEIDPDYERRYRGHMVLNAQQPDWRSDPTYDLRRKKP